MNPKVSLRIGERLYNRGVQLFAGLAASILHFPPCGFLQLRAQFALFHRFDDSRDILVESFLHLRELRFQFLDALLLAFHPFRAQFLTFLFERAALNAHLLLHAIQLVAAVMQIGDKVGSLARLRCQQGAGALDDLFCKSQALRDGNAAGTARQADHEAIGGPQIHVVKFNSGIDDARSRRGVGLKPVVMRSREHNAIPGAKFVEQGHGQRRAFFRGRPGSHFVHERERFGRRRIEHTFQIQHVRGKRGKIRSNRLFVADVYEHSVEDGQNRALRCHRNARLRRERRHANCFQGHCLAAGVRATDDQDALFSTEREGHGDNCTIFLPQLVFEHWMARSFQAQFIDARKLRSCCIEVAGKSRARENCI